jgi:hypothetical protein
MDTGREVVEVGDRVAGAGDGLVEVVRRGSLVVAREVEFGAEPVMRDAGLEQFGLQVGQGLVFRPFGGAGVQVAGGVECSVGAEAGWCESELVGGVGDLGVLASVTRMDRRFCRPGNT